MPFSTQSFKVYYGYTRQIHISIVLSSKVFDLLLVAGEWLDSWLCEVIFSLVIARVGIEKFCVFLVAIYFPKGPFLTLHNKKLVFCYIGVYHNIIIFIFSSRVFIAFERLFTLSIKLTNASLGSNLLNANIPARDPPISARYCSAWKNT